MHKCLDGQLSILLTNHNVRKNFSELIPELRRRMSEGTIKRWRKEVQDERTELSQKRTEVN
jgi:hypothetical protein